MADFTALTFIPHLEHHSSRTIRLCSNPSTSSPNKKVSSANSYPGMSRLPHSTPHLFRFNSTTKLLMYSENNRGDDTQPCLRPVYTHWEVITSLVANLHFYTEFSRYRMPVALLGASHLHCTPSNTPKASSYILCHKLY